MAQKPQQFDVLGETRARIDRPRDSLALVFKRALELGLDDVSKDGGVRFTVGTMCSGTDAPILALRELQDAALAMGYNHLFDFDHQFSVEIEAYKQAFIERNSKPSGEIYRDVVQVSDPSRKDATTAHGSLAPIPAAPDLLVAGSSCVDFSKLNNKRDILAKHSVLSRLYEEAKNTRNGLDFGTVTPQSQSHDVRMALQDVRDSFHMEGESVKTFGSILQFIYDQRPKLIILENVSHAPWRAFTHFWLPLAYIRGTSSRVQDLLDITWLSERKKAGRDLNYKAKYLDLGVGVERLKTQIGIVGWKEQELKLRQFGTPQTVQCEIPGLWRSVHQTNGTLMNISMSDVHLAPDRMTAETSEDLHVIIPGALSFPDVAQAPIPLWKTDGEIFKECAKETGPGEKWMRVSDHHHKDALSLISFALGALKADHLPREFKVGLLERAGAACQILDADFPNPKIHLLWEGLKVKKLFDDSEAAQKLAESYRKRPLPLELDVQIVRADQPRHTGDLYSGRARGNIAQETELIVRILFNPTALAHRAWLHLPRDGLIRGIRRDVMQDGHIGFAVDVEFVDPSLKMIEPFEACLSQDVVPPATCDMAIQLPSFDSCGVQLRPDQIQSVQWMIEKESSNSCFVETEVEEFLVPSSSIRLRSHAEVVNRARGGVLAHDVGFGKTIVTLALIDHQRNQSDERSTIERHAWTQERHCHLKATLIVCPPQIVDQWRDEIERFLGSENWNVVVINAKTPFHRGMLETADLVILSTAFIHSSAFVQTLTRVAGAAKFHDASGASSREFNIWYREAVTDLEDSYQCYADNNKNNGALAKHISLRTQERKVSFEKARAACIVESRRKDQKVKATARTQRATKTRKKPRRTTTAASESDHSAESDSDSAMDDRKRKVATPHVVNDFKDATVLQMYSFDRVVLDEFSYENKSTAAFVANCVASSKWILSGTPPMADLSQVCAIADLVNIHVARPEASVPKSFPSITRGPRLDKTTRGEAMRQYADPKSAQFALERHEQARIFIEHKMTRRETDISHIRVTEQVIVCRLDPVSSVVYAQLQQVLYDARWDIEEVPGDMRAIIDWLLQQTGNNKASKARENLRMSWHNTIQSLLVQSSTNLSAYGENMKKLGMDVRAGAVSGITVLTSMRTIYQRLQARSKAMIKSQFDMLMYVVDQVQMSGLLAMTNAKGRDKTKQDKAIYYQDHLDDFIQRFTADRPWSFGDAEIRDDLYRAIAPRT
ncbi:hypothetical protein D7B24_006891 [Verticillium nonalfalfae]|uniref:Helicase ATP-binding domain-containing protein n=1 Tax=Verticillium nonalfalfae TaxID=1051616 RepID=A0A3M9Y8E7_9PEZI|nr:uncharacterized protein D7B24_006891 [Verticillium nonalfalfae]RNJ56759.1 hypothetical protein D7B24_006891 [Verticillium nonalfalfae]